MKPFIIPFFLVHQGCPHRCIYCDQRRAGGRRAEPLTPEAVKRGIKAGLASPRRRPGARVEAAFFGGTFTALPHSRQEELLDAVAPYIQSGRVQGLRLSTRPDALSLEQIEFLKSKQVTNIEIGAQSFDDQVLRAGRRGHTAAQTRAAARRVKAAGLALGVQLLPGLPGEDDDSRAKTLGQTLDLDPDEARLYPLLVLKGTPLAELYLKGRYQPLTLDQTVGICADMYTALTKAGTRVIRIGLQDSPELSAAVLAGPYHPGFGHLVKSEVFGRAMARALASRPAKTPKPAMFVAPDDLAQAVGDRRRNPVRLSARFGLDELSLKTAPSLDRGRFLWQGQEYFIYDN